LANRQFQFTNQTIPTMKTPTIKKNNFNRAFVLLAGPGPLSRAAQRAGYLGGQQLPPNFGRRPNWTGPQTIRPWSGDSLGVWSGGNFGGRT